MPPPNIQLDQRSIPPGYIVGRQSPGVGPQELISFADLAAAVVALGVVAAPGSSWSPVLISGTGLVSKTGASTFATRTLTGPAAGITVSNGDGVSGDPTLALANDLAALEALSTTGMMARTAAETYTMRTITGTANRISIADGDGIAGNPTINIHTSYVGQNTITTLGTVATGTWQATKITLTYGGTNADASGWAAGTIPFIASGAFDDANFIWTGDTRPASTTTTGVAIGSNYATFGEVDFWNTIENDANAQGWYWYQKTGASAERLVLQMYFDNTATDFFILGGGDVIVGFGADNSAEYAFNGTLTEHPFLIYTNNDVLLSGPPVIVPVGFQHNVVVEAHTSDYSPDGDNGSFEFGIVATNTGASGTVIVTLPSDAETGWRNTYVVDAAQTFRLQCPASHTIRIGTSVSAAAGKAESNTVGSTVEIVKLDTNKFVALSSLGSWTVT